MKKTLFFAFIVAAFVCGRSSFVAAQNLKIGYVQIDSVLSLMPEFKAAQSELSSYQNMIQKDLQNKQQQLQTKYQTYQQQRETFSPVQLKQLEEEINTLNEEFQQAQAQAQERLQKKQQDLLFPIYDKIRTVIKTVGKENGYVLIFNELDGTNTQYILYAAEGTNATGLVIEKLGLK